MIRFHFWKFSLEGMSRLRRVCIFTCHILFSHSEFRHKFCDDLWNHEQILHFISMSAFDLRKMADQIFRHQFNLGFYTLLFGHPFMEVQFRFSHRIGFRFP